MTDLEIYVRLLEAVREAGVAVRTGTVGEHRNTGLVVPGFYHRGTRHRAPGEPLEGPSCRPTIVVRELETGPDWFRAPTSWRGISRATLTADEFASGASNPIDEAIVVAHQLGHHLSTEEQHDPADAAAYDAYLERSRERLRREQGSRAASPDDADLVYEEERHAWHLARKVLRRIGFTDFQRFEEIRRQSLAAYEQLITQVLPAWSPQEPSARC